MVLAAVAVFWVRGYWRADHAQVSYAWYPQPHLYRSRWLSLKSAQGKLEIAAVRNDFDLRYPGEIVSNGNEPGWVDSFRQRKPSGFGGTYGAYTIEPGVTYISAPRFALGFGVSHEDQVKRARHDEYWNLAMPNWFVMLMTAIVPALWLRRPLRLRQRRRNGLCLHCGYDLRASSGKCPECGTAIRARI